MTPRYAALLLVALHAGLEALATSGCTDPNAYNYAPSATADDGTCAYCSAGELTLVATMTSASADGWNGATYVLTDANGGTLLQFGALDFAQTGDYLSVGQDIFCLAADQDCVVLTVDGPVGSTGGIGWSLGLLGAPVEIEGEGSFGPFPMFFEPGAPGGATSAAAPTPNASATIRTRFSRHPNNAFVWRSLAM